MLSIRLASRRTGYCSLGALDSAPTYSTLCFDLTHFGLGIEEIGGSDSMTLTGSRPGRVSANEELLHCL
jgi:hypothetical protein